jgi:hypothetical protein
MGRCLVRTREAAPHGKPTHDGWYAIGQMVAISSNSARVVGLIRGTCMHTIHQINIQQATQGAEGHITHGSTRAPEPPLA